MNGAVHAGVLINSSTMELNLQYPIIRVLADGMDIAWKNWYPIHLPTSWTGLLLPAPSSASSWQSLLAS